MMTITIKYFGVIAEETGKDEEILRLDVQEYDLETLKKDCISKYKITDTQSIQIAINQTIGTSGVLKNGDEVAFLPPFSGG